MTLIEQRGSMTMTTMERDEQLESTFVTRDGTKLHVVESGPVDAPVTAYFVHGWTQDNTGWGPIIEHLPSDVRVVRHDNRGHGKSDPALPGTRTLEALADDLAEVIEARVPHGPIVLIGHSMGGMTLMALAERHPELVGSRVAGVAFVATSSGNMNRISLGLKGALGRSVPRVEPILRKLLERRKKGTLPGNPRVLASAGRWLVFGKKAKREHVIETVRIAWTAHPASLGGFIDTMFAHDRTVVLSALRETPTVVMAGDRDRLCPVDHARAIADGLEDTDFVLFPGAGHMLMYERTREVAREVVRLLRSAGSVA